MKRRISPYLAIAALMTLVSLSFAVSCSQPKDDSDDSGGELDLASLTVSVGKLVPEFDKDVTEYSVSVENGVTSVTVGTTPADKYAGVGQSPGNPVDLAVGLNDIVITVTADDFDFSDPDPDKLKRYYVNVTRAAQ